MPSCSFLKKIVFVAPCFLIACSITLHIQAEDRVSYSQQIIPLLKKNCFSCHGENKTEGGLRLDSKEAIARGGDSQEPIFGTSIESSEVIKRVTSNDPDYRMPPKGEALEKKEIALIENWIQQGTVFDTSEEPIQTKTSGVDKQQSFYELFPDNFYTFWGIYSFAFLTIVVLIIESRKQKISKSKDEHESAKTHWLRKINIAHYFCAYLLLGFVFLFSWHLNQIEANEKQIEKLKESTAALRLQNSQLQGFGMLEKYYGKPPRPKRLDHPVGLSQTYYRGNDERSPDLYNGGYYRTSKMDLKLIDNNGVPLKPGDKFPDKGAFVEFQFDKPPGTSQNLYQESVISKTFISSEYPYNYAEVDPRKVQLEALESGKQWTIKYPIVKKKNANSINGVLYVYFGKRIEFGIVYNIRFKDGRIDESSDVWMGNLLCMPKLLPPNDFDYITQEEWFHYKPIPIPKRHKKQSAKLLGEDEHLKKKSD